MRFKDYYWNQSISKVTIANLLSVEPFNEVRVCLCVFVHAHVCVCVCVCVCIST